MELTREVVEQVALLARLELQPNELDAMTRELGRIVEFVEQLDELQTDDVEPLAHPVERFNVFAEDEIRPGLDREDALANAPDRDAECFRVPAVLGD